MTARSRRSAAASDDPPEREMVTLLDPDGQEFTTGHLPTVNNLLCAGYTLKGEESREEIVERLAPQVTDATAEPAPGQ